MSMGSVAMKYMITLIKDDEYNRVLTEQCMLLTQCRCYALNLVSFFGQGLSSFFVEFLLLRLIFLDVQE